MVLYIYGTLLLSQMIPVLFLDTIPFILVSDLVFIDSVLVTEVLSFTTEAHNMVSEVAYNGNNLDGSISTTVYRKATQTDRYFNFKLHHPLAHKLAVHVVKTLHSRAGAICSDVTAKDQETWHIRQALINNGYPRGVLQQHAIPADQD